MLGCRRSGQRFVGSDRSVGISAHFVAAVSRIIGEIMNANQTSRSRLFSPDCAAVRLPPFAFSY